MFRNTSPDVSFFDEFVQRDPISLINDATEVMIALGFPIPAFAEDIRYLRDNRLTMQRPNKTLILGNGFDLDLGFPTTYASFAASQFWPLKDEDSFHSPLAHTLEDAKNRERWFDIEDLLFRYAKERELTDKDHAVRVFGSVQSDRDVYHKVCNALCVYIQVIQPRKAINKESMAARVLKAISANGTFNKVLSFNYSDLNDICSRVGCTPLTYKHVHGSAKKGTIILGVSDEHRLQQGYDCLYKSQSIYYKSSGVRTALMESSEIVFFGHSLGLQDIAYFSDFIKGSADVSQTSEGRRRITFFTKDASSQEQLMLNIRALNPTSFGRFRDLNDVVFIRTEDVDQEDIEDFFEHLDSTSLAAQQRIVDGLVRELSLVSLFNVPRQCACSPPLPVLPPAKEQIAPKPISAGTLRKARSTEWSFSPFSKTTGSPPTSITSPLTTMPMSMQCKGR